MTARRPLPPEPRRTVRRSWVLTEDGAIDPIAVEIAAGRILARGATLSLISRRLRVNGSAARALAAQYRQDAAS